MALTICTQTRDRNSFLERSIVSWLSYPCTEILIVDWFGKESVLDVINPAMDDRVRILQLKNGAEYTRARARNMAFRNSRHEQILYLDSDIIIGPKYPKSVPLPEKAFRQGIRKDGKAIDRETMEGQTIEQRHIDRTFGCILLWKKAFLDINGFNERLVGWGYEDTDFHDRISSEWTHMQMPPGLVHIDHDDGLRTSMNDGRDLWLGMCRNRSYALAKPWGLSDVQELLWCTEYVGKKRNKIKA